VVCRDLVAPAGLLGFRVAVGVAAAAEPEHGGRVHSAPNDPKSSRAGAGPVGRTRSADKVPAERIGDGLARRGSLVAA
jgi:hypothetical protein